MSKNCREQSFHDQLSCPYILLIFERNVRWLQRVYLDSDTFESTQVFSGGDTIACYVPMMYVP